MIATLTLASGLTQVFFFIRYCFAAHRIPGGDQPASRRRHDQQQRN